MKVCSSYIVSLFFLCLITISVSGNPRKGDKPASVKSGTTEYRFFEITPILRDHLEDVQSAIEEAARIGFRIEKTGYGITGSGKSGRYRAWVIMSRDLNAPQHQRYEYLVLKSNDIEVEINALKSSLAEATEKGFEVRGILSSYEYKSFFNSNQVYRAALFLERAVVGANSHFDYQLFGTLPEMQHAGYRLLAAGGTFIVGWRNRDRTYTENEKLEYKDIPHIKELMHEDAPQQKMLERVDSPGCRLETSRYLLTCNTNDKSHYGHKVVLLVDLLHSQAEWQALVSGGYELRIVFGGPFKLFAGLERDPTEKNSKTVGERRILHLASFTMKGRKQLDELLASGYQIDNVLITQIGTLVFTLGRIAQTGH